MWLILFPAAVAFLMLFSAGVLHRTELFYKRGWHIDVLFGIAWYIVGRFVSIWLMKFFVLPSHGIGLYMQALLPYLFPFWFFALAGFLILNHFKGSDHISNAYISGYGICAGLSVVLGLSHPADPYILFVFPVLIGVSVVYVSELRQLIVTGYGLGFAGAVAGVIAAPFLLASVSFLYYRNYTLWALFSFAVVSGPGLVILYRQVSAQLSKTVRA